MTYAIRVPGDAPRRRVTRAMVRGGGSILQPAFKHHWWSLTLECGHTVERRIRWLPPKDGRRPGRRGWAAQWHGVSLDRLPAEPQHARCEVCASGGS